MRDILTLNDGEDLGIQDTIVPKAANVLSIQLGDLEYAKDFGVDLRYFLESEFQIQGDSFKSYLVQRLTESKVNVAEVLETIETFYRRYSFSVGEVNSSGGLIT